MSEGRMKRESGGSASIIIIAILFLALMATLGVVFYQNFIQKSQPTKTSNTTTTTNNDQSLKTARFAFNNGIYAIDYPATGWKVATQSANADSYAMLLSGDETVKVTLQTASFQSKTACDTNDGLQIDNYNVSSSPVVTKLASNPLYLVEAITDAPGGGYQYSIGLMPDGGETHASVGASHCTVANVGMTDLLVMNGSTITKPAITTSITFPKLPSAPHAAAPDMDTLKTLMKSDTYKAAVKILESARKE